ncbi:hypothetical protein ACRHK7_05155 [Weissella tructae]|uniref:Uncharacterized protein n=2 Tax=Weissella TaxID=46255 RepID=A0A075U6K3_9LACO|nr:MULTISPECIES: hypothetical protein [Weissella]AIG65772.1 hypothetical protein WS08_0833 [Weissella tructae]AIM63151.1 hypothetical protein WS74_0899 [Weissella ceti]AIM64487.1 hypothetical protein WS105_0897 [Weissella ceti]ELA06775.1 hypothetical protein WCNC_04327 [Weissella ceti NC36]QVV90934.1 hypothetical protein KHQ32_04690 [Weissella tructae]
MRLRKILLGMQETLLFRANVLRKSFNMKVVYAHVFIFMLGVVGVLAGKIDGFPYALRLQEIGLYLCLYCIVFLIIHSIGYFVLDTDHSDSITDAVNWFKNLSRRNKLVWVYSFVPVLLIALMVIFEFPDFSSLSDFVTVVTIAVLPPFLWAMKNN